MSNRLQSYQINNYADAQNSDAAGFEAISRAAPGPVAYLNDVTELLGAIGRRPGTVEALLIGPDRTIAASGTRVLVGSVDSDPRINAALNSGLPYRGREADPTANQSDFEFVTPVNLPTGRYALEMTFTDAAFQEQLAGLRHILVLIGLLALVGVSALFYLFGGKALLRDHRIALQRATRDGLTDLPNQRAFQDEFEQAVAAAGRHPVPLTIALIDLDHFKLVNDRHGHPQGDALLVRVADQLRDGRAADRAYRLGGDEFALLLPNTDANGAPTLMRRLSRILMDAGISASLGVSTMREGLSADELRAEADAALYEAKRRGGNGFVHFGQIRDQVAVTTAGKREAVGRLIDEGLLTTVFQPIWRFDSRDRPLGFEALTRPDPSYGLTGPAEAFDVAEQIGRVHELDELCATRAILIGSTIPEDALLFVNLAPKTLELDAVGNDWLLEAAERADLRPDRIVVEVTERIGAHTTAVLKGLGRLREQGFQLALDDVGTGNAGLEMLRRIDAEFVKIDRSIVAVAATEPNARAVLMAMATFARQTGAFVIAEGIEDDETLDFLRKIERFEHQQGTIIQGGQGFNLGEPLPALPQWTSAIAQRPAGIAAETV
jgi:diguanylate cyclase (GGDEF)-like protein